MTRTSSFTTGQALASACVTAAFLTAFGLAHAQSTTQGPANDAAGSNVQNSQGMGADTSTPAARPDTSGSTMNGAAGSTSPRSSSTTTQTAPQSTDSDRDASQGMAAGRDTTGTGSTSSGMSDSMSRPTQQTARAPRADRN